METDEEIQVTINKQGKCRTMLLRGESVRLIDSNVVIKERDVLKGTLIGEGRNFTWVFAKVSYV